MIILKGLLCSIQCYACPGGADTYHPEQHTSQALHSAGHLLVMPWCYEICQSDCFSFMVRQPFPRAKAMYSGLTQGLALF